MVVLDTNVVSELMRDDPHSGVLVWLDDRFKKFCKKGRRRV